MPRPATALMPELYTLAEAAQLTGIDAKNLRSAARICALSAYKIGKAWMVSRDQIDEYLSSCLNTNRPKGKTGAKARTEADHRARIATKLAA